MSMPRRRAVAAVITAGAALLLPFALSAPAAAHSQDATARAEQAATVTCPEIVDGFQIDHLPAGIGDLVTDFAYEWEEVAFKSRVWETGPDEHGAYRVDLTIKVLRGERLTGLAALRDYLVEYYEYDPADWELTEYDHNGDPGYLAADEAFWLVEPGVAVSVRIADHLTEADLLQTADSIRPAKDTGTEA